MISWFGLYSSIGFMFALSIDEQISKWERVKIGLFWIMIVPILLLYQLPLFEEKSCLNDSYSSSLSSPAQMTHEQKQSLQSPDTQTLLPPDFVTSVAVNTIQHALALEQLLPEDIWLLEQSVVVDTKGVARVVPSALINKKYQ